MAILFDSIVNSGGSMRSLPPPAQAGRRPRSDMAHVARRVPGIALFVFELLVVGLAARPAVSAPGDEHWWGGFGLPGVSSTVRALHVQGPDLFLGGDFIVAGSVPAVHVARYDGAGFYPVGEGLDGPVRALATWNGQLVAGGNFTHSGATALNNVALWDGTAWQPLGQGVEGDFSYVAALAEYDGRLYAGGRFTTAGGQQAANIACWDGVAWTPLSSGLNGYVDGLIAFGGELIMGGFVTLAGGTPVSSGAAWNGSTWRAFGSSHSATNFLVMNDTLYGGYGSYPYGALLRWNGTDWDALPQGGPVYAMTTHAGSLITGGAMFGMFPVDTCCLIAHLGVSDGVSTHAQLEPGGYFSNGMNGMTYALAEYNGQIIAGGSFTTAAGDVSVGRLARWTGTTFEPLVPATDFSQGTDYRVTAATAYPTGGLAVGGDFLHAGGMTTHFVALWSGYGWQSLDLSNTNYARYDGGPTIEDMTTWNGKLVVAGSFFKSGFPTMGLIFNGGIWTSPPPGGPSGSGVVKAVTVFNDDLYIGGDFYLPLVPTICHLARLTAAGVWSPLGTPNGSVEALTVYRNELLVGGAFTQIGGIPANRVARWNGTTWNALGAGLDKSVFALYPAGPRLYVGGSFAQAGGQPAGGVAQWSGGTQTWSALAGGVSNTYSHSVNAINSHNGDIVVAGRFNAAGGVPVNNIARWDGTGWAPLGSGVDGDVHLLADFNGLLVGGAFGSAGLANSGHLALWDDAAVSAVDVTLRPAPGELALHAVGPNPTAGSLDFTVVSPVTAEAQVQVLDIQGRLVRRLFVGTLPAGEHPFHWDGRSDGGAPVSAGLYLLRASGAQGAAVRKILVRQ